MIKNEKVSGMKIEDLAAITKRGFDEVMARHDGHEKAFEKINEWQRLADGRFDSIEMELMDIKEEVESFLGS